MGIGEIERAVGGIIYLTHHRPLDVVTLQTLIIILEFRAAAAEETHVSVRNLKDDLCILIRWRHGFAHLIHIGVASCGIALAESARNAIAAKSRLFVILLYIRTLSMLAYTCRSVWHAGFTLQRQSFFTDKRHRSL